MNRIDQLFRQKKQNILSIYFTAGHPALNSTVLIIEELEKNGADMIEIGMPFSDPLADGPVIQHSSHVALKNGMSINLLFEQLKPIREKVNLPLLLMGYLNPVLRYGFDRFCSDASAIGIDGFILPDLPLLEYNETYRKTVEGNNLNFSFLFSPETSNQRAQMLDEAGRGFNYIVASSSTTGMKDKILDAQVDYFKRIQSLKLKNPSLIGFGISNHETYKKACQYANGVIIGSAFVKALQGGSNLQEKIKRFVEKIVTTQDAI